MHLHMSMSKLKKKINVLKVHKYQKSWCGKCVMNVTVILTVILNVSNDSEDSDDTDIE